MTELELKLKDSIDQIFKNTSAQPWRTLGIMERQAFVKCIVRNDTNDADLKIQLFLLTENGISKLRTCLWVLSDSETDRENWGWAVIENKWDDVPESEEHYFQLSTVNELGYSLEFFQYLVNVLKYKSN